MQTRASRRAFRITLIYFTLAAGWVLSCNAVLEGFANTLNPGLNIGVIKDWGFLVLMGAGLFHVWRRSESEIEQRKAAPDDFRRMERALKTISAGNGALVRATSETMLLTEICRVIVEQGGHRMAWVGFANNDQRRSVRIAAL